MASPKPPRIYLSHSAFDAEVVGEFGRLLSKLLPIQPDEIRCTDFTAAEPNVESLDCVVSARILINFVSEDSLRSPAVALEWDARLTMQQHDQSRLTMVVLIRDMNAAALPAALSGVECARADSYDALVDLLGVLAAETGVTDVLSLAPHAAQMKRVVNLARKSRVTTSDTSGRGRRMSSRNLALVAMSVILLLCLVWLAQVAFSRFTRPAVFDFESSVQGWAPLTSGDGCVSVERTSEKAKRGHFSLRMRVDLDGTDPRRQQATTSADMRITHVSSSLTVPVDLSNKIITAWVYAPPGAGGTPSKPTGFQLFVKDEAGHSEYGPWHNVIENAWQRVSMTVGSRAAPTGYMAQDFIPTRITDVGLKMAVGTGASLKYSGAVYLDTIGW